MNPLDAKDLDEPYRDKISKAVIRAIVEASISDDRSVALLKTGEICSALITVIASMACTSEACSTPTKIRFATSEFERKLRRQIALLREEYRSGNLPFNVANIQ